MKEEELLWAMLPEGLEDYFELENYEKNDKYFRIILIEKNQVPKLSEQYRGRRIINTVIKSITVDCFPIKGLKAELVLKRRYWKFEGVKEWLKRKIEICTPGTKLEKKFADFLKEFDRKFPNSYFTSSYMDELKQLNS